ncbi:MAG: alpha/beta hydrolase [Acidisphaera sp.]|nr:alpha/beta hydrolase [Acidisphaera sp.]
MISRLASAILPALLVLSLASAGRAMPVVPEQSRFFVASDGVRLHYLEAGRGHTIVFIPGWDMPAWIWQRQIDDLARFYHVVAFDPRSQGDSDIAPTGNEPFRRGQDIAELLATVSLEPVVLVGWSLGVLDALAYVHEHGDNRLAGLVLVDNSVGEDPAPLPPAVPRGVRRARMRVSRELQMRRFVAGMFHTPQPEEFLDRLTETALRTPPAISAELLEYPVPRSYWKEAIYATYKPILYVVRPSLEGQADNLQARHAGAETAIFADAGHALFIDDADRFDDLVENFVQRRVWPGRVR